MPQLWAHLPRGAQTAGRRGRVRRLRRPAGEAGDDDELTARRRLAVYREQAAPLERFYAERDLLHQVDAETTPDEVIERSWTSWSGSDDHPEGRGAGQDARRRPDRGGTIYRGRAVQPGRSTLDSTGSLERYIRDQGDPVVQGLPGRIRRRSAPRSTTRSCTGSLGDPSSPRGWCCRSTSARSGRAHGDAAVTVFVGGQFPRRRPRGRQGDRARPRRGDRLGAAGAACPTSATRSSRSPTQRAWA